MRSWLDLSSIQIFIILNWNFIRSNEYIYIFYHSSAFSNLCLNNSSYSSFILNKPKESFFYIIYILGKVYIIIRRKHGKSRSSCRVRVRIPTDRLKRDTRCSFLSIPRHFPVSVFHDCQMRSPVFSRSCLSPLLSLSSLPAYRDESARHESNDRRGFRFQRGGAEWRVKGGGEKEEDGKGNGRDPPRIRDPRMFPRPRARALFCRFVSRVPGTILMRGNDLPGFAAAPRENLIIEKVELWAARSKIARR